MMTVIRYEIKQSRISFLIWTGAVGFLLAVCIFLFPEMKGEMEGINRAFSSMGVFTAAFGMDRLNFGSLTGYYAIECVNVLGLGGAFFAALYAAGMLSKEEKDRTAEFLLTHPVSRGRIVAEKLAAVLLRITEMNLVIFLLAVGSIAVIGESIPWKELFLMHAACFLMQLELACICFGLSSFLHQGSTGAGLGIAIIMYFLSLTANITKSAAFLKYVTPFSWCSGADIISSGALDGKLIAAGAVLSAAGLLTAFLVYTRRDIH